MQKVSLIINAILLLAVGILFYLFLSNKSKTTQIKTPEGAKIDNSVKIAYVDIDSLQAQYNYFVDKKAEIEKEVKSIESSLISQKKQFETEVMKFENDAPGMTQNEIEKKQMKLQEKQMQLQQLEMDQSDKMEKRMTDFNELFLKRIEDYIKKFNADKKYAFVLTYSRNSASLLYTDPQYDITKLVVDGLNKEYEASLK